jgi:hypothetical protein
MRGPKAWDQPCAHSACARFKRMNRGHGRALSTSLTASGQRRICCCRDGRTTVSETRDPVCCALRTPEEPGIMAVKRLRVRVERAGIAFVLGVTAETVLAWLRRAALKAQAITTHLRRERPVTQVQRDARGTVVARQHARETAERGETRPDAAEGRPWVWVRCAPAFHLLRAAVVGPRTLATATEGIATTQARVRGIPACCSEAFPCALAALMACFPTVTTWPSTGTRGRPRQPVLTPPPALVDGPLGQAQTPGTLVTISPRVLLGAARFTPCGLGLSTARVERVNLPLRPALAPLVRHTARVGKARVQRRRRGVFLPAVSNVARPHMRWRPQWPMPAGTRQGAIRLRWRERTPAMAAGRTEHVWTFRALLTATFEPLDAQSIRG